MTPVRKASAAEKATAARVRDLKHLAEVALARPVRGSESSVSVTRNAKGQWQFAVEVNSEDPDEAYRKACELAQALALKFRYVPEPVEKVEARKTAQRAASIATRRAKAGA